MSSAGTPPFDSTLVDSPDEHSARPIDMNAQSVSRIEGGNPTSTPSAPPRQKPGEHAKSQRLFDKIEAFISRLSVRDNFWHRVCSLIWLPYAFFSGIRMKQMDDTSFTAVLPFVRFNRNWYRAMAGGALLANSEIAGGMYVFGICGGDYTVVCKNLQYTFLRPCFGPAIYKIKPRENVKALVASKSEFNITLDLEVAQQVYTPGQRDKRVGRCEATFHVTPKIQHQQKALRGKNRE